MGIIGWIVLGLIAGAIAKAIMPGDDPGGIIVTMLIGIVGAIVGGFIASALDVGEVDEFFSVGTWLIADSRRAAAPRDLPGARGQPGEHRPQVARVARAQSSRGTGSELRRGTNELQPEIASKRTGRGRVEGHRTAPTVASRPAGRPAVAAARRRAAEG